MKFAEYIASIERGLFQNPVVSAIDVPALLSSDDYNGLIKYDNAPHHPEVATHPHHKHIGPADHLAPADQPSLGQILVEIEDWLRQQA